MAQREQRVGGMDSELLATFGANESSSASKEVRLQVLFYQEQPIVLCSLL